MKSLKLFSNIRLLMFLLGGMVLFASCTKQYDDINTNKNSIKTVGPSEFPFLFSAAQSVATINQGNYQVAENLFADQYAQYFACVATYFPSDRLTIRMDWVGAAFNPVYTTVVPQLQTLFANFDATTSEHALANIIWVLAFHKVTDYWGPIPYFQAGKVAATVPYDGQDKIYDDMLKRLDSAIAVLQGKPATETPYANFDIIYGGAAGGTVKKWLKFANTLKLRLALRISAVDPGRAQTEAEAAVASGVMTTSSSAPLVGDDALIQRSTKGGDGNGLSIMSDWNEFRMSASMESVLTGYKDPRLPLYFIPAVGSATGAYKGLRNGLTVAQLTDASNINKAVNNSHVGPRWASPSAGGIPTYLSSSQNVIETAEAYFLRAEGAMLGWSMGGTPQSLYEDGIRNSLIQWGITDNTVINNYINSPLTPVAPGDFLNSPAMTNIPVLWGATAAIQKEQIATQKWLALFPDGIEAWADYRRSHVLKLYPVANSDNSDITNTSTQWIRRIPFLLSETQTNGAAVTAAASLLGGPDKVTTPLWWDKN